MKVKSFITKESIAFALGLAYSNQYDESYVKGCKELTLNLGFFSLSFGQKWNWKHIAHNEQYIYMNIINFGIIGHH